MGGTSLGPNIVSDFGGNNPPQYVQGGMFGGMSFQPLGWGADFGSTPAQTPAISPAPGLPGSTLNTGIQSGGSVAGGGGPPVGITGATVGIPGPSTASAPAATTPAATSGSSGPFGLPVDWFPRLVLIVLGMIFVAVGLKMLAPSLPIAVPGVK